MAAIRRSGECKLNKYRSWLRRTPALLAVSEEAYTGASQKDVQADTCMFVLGPVLLSFLWWVMKQAEQNGIQRLYFLARDGYLMYLMAERLCQAEGFSVDCRYLYSSRNAWRIPEYHLIGAKSLERVCRGGMDVSFSSLMQRAGLAETEGRRIAAQLGMEDRYRELLSWREVQKLRKPLSESREFMEGMNRHSSEAYADTIAYFRQEGLLDPIDYAIVDSGWIGTMQESLQELLHSAGDGRRIEGYYFGLYAIPDGADADRYHGFYFEPSGKTGRKAHFSNCLFECIFTAPHGMTMGYCREGRRTEPVLGKVMTQNQEQIHRLLSLMDRYMDVLQDRWNEKLGEEVQRLPADRLLESFMSHPSREEAACYGSFLFSDDVTEETLQPLAAALTTGQLWDHHPVRRALIMLGLTSRKLKDSGWIEGSIRLYGKKLAPWHRQGAVLYKYGICLKAEYRFRKARKAA